MLVSKFIAASIVISSFYDNNLSNNWLELLQQSKKELILKKGIKTPLKKTTA
jgi:hypothetical protein